MSTAAKPLSEIAAQWREARKLYEVYSALLEHFALGLPPCRELETPIDRADPESIERVQSWLAQMDDRVHVHQLRQLLQGSKLGSSEENLHALIHHHLSKEKKTDSDRDKIDFLLVQYLSCCAPADFYDKNVSFEEIAQVLEPVLGEVGLHPPKWQEPLEKATNQLENLRSLRDLLEQGTLDQMRQLKAGAGEMYFGPTALVAITRFNFLVRRTFVRLIAADLHAIRFSLHELERRGVKAVDCSRADLLHQMPIEELRQICHEWKKPFRAAYAAGQNFRELIEIRAAVEEALAHAPEPGAAPVEAGATKAPAPAASTAAKDGIPATAPASPAAAKTEDASQKSDGIHLEVTKAAPKTAGKAPGLLAGAELPQKEKKEAVSAHGVVSIRLYDREFADASAALEATVEQILKELTKLHIKEPAVANVVLGGVKLMLSTWEVGAFIKGGNETNNTLQSTVAARALLLTQIEQQKRGQAVDLASVLKAAQQESTKIQKQIDAAKQKKDIDSAVNLAATSKRLVALLEEAGKSEKR